MNLSPPEGWLLRKNAEIGAKEGIAGGELSFFASRKINERLISIS
jgi:hypothetical protein